MSETMMAGWKPSSSACGVPPTPVLALLTAVTTASTSDAELEGRVEQTADESLLVARDTTRRADVERPEREAEAEAGEHKGRKHRRGVPLVEADREEQCVGDRERAKACHHQARHPEATDERREPRRERRDGWTCPSYLGGRDVTGDPTGEDCWSRTGRALIHQHSS